MNNCTNAPDAVDIACACGLTAAHAAETNSNVSLPERPTSSNHASHSGCSRLRARRCRSRSAFRLTCVPTSGSLSDFQTGGGETRHEGSRSARQTPAHQWLLSSTRPHLA